MGTNLGAERVGVGTFLGKGKGVGNAWAEGWGWLENVWVEGIRRQQELFKGGTGGELIRDPPPP